MSRKKRSVEIADRSVRCGLRRAAYDGVHMLTDEQLEDFIEIGHLARMLKMRGEAEAIFRSLEIVFPDRAFPHTGMALLHLEEQRFTRACSEFSASLVLADNPAVRAWYATALHCKKQYKAAAEQVSLVLAATDVSTSSRSARGMAQRLSQMRELKNFLRKRGLE